ncbi:hypothetical protein BJX64DRAFT_291235 [Aspergillus heterothallicus]
MALKNPSAAAFSRTLDVSFTSFTKRHMRICSDTKDGPPLYTVDLHPTKPNVIFHRAQYPESPPYTASFHRLSHDVDISMNGKEIVKLTWERASKWKSFWLDCVDDGGVVYAEYRPHGGFKKGGVLNLLEPCVSGGEEMLDEVVVTFVVNLYMLMRIATASAAGG